MNSLPSQAQEVPVTGTPGQDLGEILAKGDYLRHRLQPKWFLLGKMTVEHTRVPNHSIDDTLYLGVGLMVRKLSSVARDLT